MKQSITLEDSELSKTIIRALEEPVEKLVNNLVEGYQDSLRHNGYYIPSSDIEALKKFLRGDMTVKLTPSASITEKKLDDWHMSAIKATQSFLEIGPDTKNDDNKRKIEEAVDKYVEENPEFRAVHKYYKPEIIEDLQKTEDGAFREERKRRAGAQA